MRLWLRSLTHQGRQRHLVLDFAPMSIMGDAVSGANKYTAAILYLAEIYDVISATDQ